MELGVEDLIRGKYYCVKYSNTNYYFKYKYYDKYYVYSSGYEIVKSYNNDYEYQELIDKGIFCDKEWIYECDSIKEIYFKDILKYLPNNNPDKKYYLRKQKIKSLLNM